MTDLNSILVEGEVVVDPVPGEGELPVSKFTIASRRTMTDGEKEITYLDVMVAGRMAELCNETLRKGRRVRVVGRIVAEGDPETVKRFFASRFTYVVAEHVEFRPQRFTDKDQSVGKKETENVGND